MKRLNSLRKHGLKVNKKHEWKRHGLNMDNFDDIYDRHINIINCEVCNCKLTIDKNIRPTTKCMDHNHITNYYRHTICNLCNIQRGFIDKKYLQVIQELRSIFKVKSVILKFYKV